MKIPLIYADKPLEVVHTPNVGVGEMAQSQVGAEVVELSGLIAQRQAVLQERERVAQEALQAVETDTEINKRVTKEKEYFLTSPDYETYDARKQAFLGSLKEEFGPKEGASKEAKIAFARSFNRYSNELGDFVTSRKYKVMEERSLSAINDLMVQKGEEYAALTDQTDRDLKIKSTELEIRKLMDAGTVSQLVGENKIREIEKTFKTIDEDAALASAINRMSTDPAQLAVDLKDPSYLPGLKDKSKRATMSNQAEHAARMKKDQDKMDAERAESKARENDNRRIGNLMLEKKYEEAYAESLKSKWITGADKDHWRISSENALIPKPIKVDKKVEAKEMGVINDMLRANVPIDELRMYVTGSSNLGDEMRISYMKTIETDYSSELKELRSLGLSTLENKIIPKRSQMTTEKYIKTPLEEEASAMAGVVFVNWFEKRQLEKRRITREEIVKEAMAIGYDHQITTTNRIRWLENYYLQQQEESEIEAKRKEREKKGLPPEPEVIRRKIPK